MILNDLIMLKHVTYPFEQFGHFRATQLINFEIVTKLKTKNKDNYHLCVITIEDIPIQTAF